MQLGTDSAYAGFSRRKFLERSSRPYHRRAGDLGAVALWLPALFGVLAICTESTRGMGSDHTIVWVQRLCSLTHLRHFDLSSVNYALRKLGHVFGYGSLGILFTRIWLACLIRWFHLSGGRLRVISAMSGVITTAITAGLDELHQSFLPNRSASMEDVVLDTFGALLLVSAWLSFKLLRTRNTNAGIIWPENYRRREADAQSFVTAVPDLAKLDNLLLTAAPSFVLES